MCHLQLILVVSEQPWPRVLGAFGAVPFLITPVKVVLCS